MELDPVILSRIQFAFVISFHIPAFTIGLAAWLATIEGVWFATGMHRDIRSGWHAMRLAPDVFPDDVLPSHRQPPARPREASRLHGDGDLRAP